MRKIAVFAQLALVGMGVSALMGVPSSFAYEGMR